MANTNRIFSAVFDAVFHVCLAGSSWAESFDAFFLEHCGVFAEFTIGAEHSFQQTDVHRKFVSTAEGLLEAQLAEKAVSPDDFLAQLMVDASGRSGLGAVNPAAAILRRLEECIDFQQFGLMMRQRHERLFSEIGQLEQAEESLQAQITVAAACAQQPRVFARIQQLEQAKQSLHAQIDAAKAHAQAQQDAEYELSLAREQQVIRDASERRRRAREDAMRRATETEAALDADKQETVPHLQPEPEPEPEPEMEPEPQTLTQMKAQTQTQPNAFGGWTSWQSHPARVVGCGWEVGSVLGKQLPLLVPNCRLLKIICTSALHLGDLRSLEQSLLCCRNIPA